MKCSDCGYKNRETAHFCQQCGAALETVSSSSNPVTPHASQRVTKPLPYLLTPQPLSSASLPDTRPLSGSSVAFAPLPEGALLHDGQYIILEERSANEQLNVYLVEGTAPVWLCPNCQTETTDPDERFCSFCGADLSDVAPLNPRYLIQESIDGQAFAAEAQLREMRMEHPGLLLPCVFFTESPYGPPRYYQVELEFPPLLADSLAIPQKLDRVLEWGIILAQALNYLHHYHVTLRDIDLNYVAVAGKNAQWTHLSTACVIPPTFRSEATNDFARDVQELATMLLYLATGQRRISDAQLPQDVMTIFDQALTAPTETTAFTFAIALESALLELYRPDDVTHLVGRSTDVGQDRALNEDSLLVLDIAPVYQSTCRPVGLFVVADGMGGHEAGDVASRLAVQNVAQKAVEEILPQVVAGKPWHDIRQWLGDATLAANQTVYDICKSTGTDMGTTLVMALVIGGTATIANVGDSRAYLLAQDGIVQITTDHSLVERLVATGQITREEAAEHPQKNVIYRVIGDKPQMEVDLFEQQIDLGNALLLCSDGLSGMVSDERIWQIWRTSTSPQEACDRLVEAANQAGGKDNISVIIVQIV